MIDRLEFLLGEAFTSMRRNTWMTFAAVTTAAMALLLIGGLGLAYLRLADYAATLPEKLVIRVFLEMDLPEDTIKVVEGRIWEIPEVASVELIPKAEGWRKMRQRLPEITEGLDNPLPDSFNVTTKGVADIDLVASKIEKIPGQDGVEYLREEYNIIEDTIRLLTLIGVGLGGMMLLTSGVLIYNAIRLAIVARHREIRIMQLVGATRSTVWIPLLIEGAVQGTIGGAIAASILWPAYQIVASLISKLAFMEQGLRPYPFVTAYVLLVLAGAVYGLICSAIAVREPRKNT
ncbi:MAG: ABC transporter permease [Armatimonadetes bacterium]|nr:ABC transporter permease [Armatimonadota bacterium]